MLFFAVNKTNERDSFASVIDGRNESNSIVLSNTSLVTSPSFTDDSFEINTSRGNPLSFSYKNGKSNANGLITLNKNYIGNAFPDYCYVGNDDPITSVSNINVSFDGGTLEIFASNDASNYYKVDVLTSSGSTILGNGYLYYRFVNGNLDETPLNLNSITFSYSCVESEYSSEASDMSNVFTLNGKASLSGGVSLDTTMHSDAFNASQPLKFTSPAMVDDVPTAMGDSTSHRWQFGFHLPRKMTGTELYNMKLSMLVNSELTSKGDGKTVELRIYPSTKYYSYHDKDLCLRVYPSAGHVGWYELSADFSSTSKSLRDDDFKDVEFEYLFVRPNHVAPLKDASEGYLFVDELRLEYVHDYPAFDTSGIDSSPEEVNDLSNNSFVLGYDAKDGDLTYLTRSKNSYRSRAITPSADNCRFHFDGFLVDMAGKTISFDVMASPANAYIKVDFFHRESETDYRYEVSARYGTENGVTIESYSGDYAGWKHYVIDFDAAMASAAKTAKSSGEPGGFGFVVAHSQDTVVYIHNVFITNN